MTTINRCSITDADLLASVLSNDTTKPLLVRALSMAKSERITFAQDLERQGESGFAAASSDYLSLSQLIRDLSAEDIVYINAQLEG
jgi:hypothetical protein